jgi:hypothetical protein
MIIRLMVMLVIACMINNIEGSYVTVPTLIIDSKKFVSHGTEHPDSDEYEDDVVHDVGYDC